MAGIYIHIPFCKQACHYCDFHFSTSMSTKGDMVLAIAKEILLKSSLYPFKKIESIYFGGGTPSLLSIAELNGIITSIKQVYQIDEQAEITLEGNPDDLHSDYLKALANDTLINRLSIGIQSFVDEDLKWMNRAHEAAEAYQCIDAARKVGFENLSIDLIFGLPDHLKHHWADNLKQAIDMELPHLSCYGLTVEPRTALSHMIAKGKTANIDQGIQSDQFLYTMDQLVSNRYHHYEISNYALPGYEAVHNSNYWNAKQYLGVGPSAHSFDGNHRSWNVSNNAKYLKGITENIPYSEEEILSPKDRYNEYIMTKMRTSKGCDVADISGIGDYFRVYFLEHVDPLVNSGQVKQNGNCYALTNSSKVIADHISSELFYAEEDTHQG